ncbi:MAG: OmpA family protein, partial [Henriciella sp.]|uniref:OmpA family protein n=1 Tax=Henriciella sp. TaxID=1968823 RepID=UPI003C713FE2
REDCAANSVTIVGHTDTSGGNAYNQRLSARRAASVGNALTTRGIGSDMISTEGRGENDLAKATRDGVREPLNRRSEVTIIVSGGPNT